MKNGWYHNGIKSGLALLFSLLLIQCTGEQETPANRYFDIQELMDQQVAELKLQRTELTKMLKIDGESESNTAKLLDSIQWENEFRIFREHDINKPVLFDAYIEEQYSTEKGNRRWNYILEDSTKSGILTMVVDFNQSGDVINWSSKFREENVLYANLRDVSINFDKSGQRITDYSINGYHKLMFKDTVFYQLQAVINYEE